MKNIVSLNLLAAVALSLAGCVVVERRTPVVVEPAPSVVGETVITTLPSGYRTRIYRGTTYYYSGDVVYRTHSGGGYTVVTRPW